MISKRQLLVGACGLASALGLGTAAYRTARVELPIAVRAGIAHALGLPVEGVSIGRTRLGIAGLEIENLAAGSFAVRHLRYVPDRWALLSQGATKGTIELDDLIIEDPPAASIDRVRIGHGEAQIGPSGARLRAHDLRIEVSPLDIDIAPVHIDEMGIELVRTEGRLSARRIAFSGLELDRFGSLAGGAHVSAQGIDVRAAGPGVRLSAHGSASAIDATIELDRRRVDVTATPILEHLGITHLDASLSGRIVAHLARENDDRPSSFDGSIVADRGEMLAPRLAPAVLALEGMKLFAHGERTEDGTEVSTELVSRGLTLKSTARLDADKRLSIDLRLPRTSCAAILASLPAALHPALDGISLDGEISGAWKLTMPYGTPSALQLDGDLDLGCKVASEPPLADAGRLRDEAPTLIGRDENGAPLRIELGPNNPYFRRLAQLPTQVVATFVEAEDGRYFRHRGLDLTQVRRALAHDLAVGAPGRGGSTITQQVAKNLFLSGERTLGRKLEEVVLAWRLEQRLDKRRILELYLNLVELGPGIYGVAAGARHWFDKDANALTAKEAAKLAALLPAPRRGMDVAFQHRFEQLLQRLPKIVQP